LKFGTVQSADPDCIQCAISVQWGQVLTLWNVRSVGAGGCGVASTAKLSRWLRRTVYT